MQRIELLKVSDIIPTKDNKRKIDVEEESFIELMESIKASGVQIPVHVRTIKNGKYELRAGQRRYTAAKELKLATIPAVIHTDMENEAALGLTYIENKFREDLKPMEEVAEISMLLDRFNGDAKIIAERIGRPEGWVRVRSNIQSSLIKEWKKIFENIESNPKFQNWSISHLTLIARLPGHLQKMFYDKVTDQMRWGANDKMILMSVNDLKKQLAELLKVLSKAKWNLDDETLVPKAGSCSKCEKRSGHQPALWYDMEDQSESGDQCLDSDCWAVKALAHLERKSVELKDKYPNLVYVTTEYVQSDEAKELHEKFGSYIDQYSFTNAAKKSDKDAIPAFILSGKGEGTLRFIKLKKDKSNPRKKVAGTVKTLKERKTTLDSKRWSQVLINLRQIVTGTEVDDLYCQDISACLMMLAAVFGVTYHYDERKEFDVKKLVTASLADAQFNIWQKLKITLDEYLRYNGPITQTPKEYIERATWIADLVQADIKKMYEDISVSKGFTEPGSWKSLNADGTPKGESPAKKKTKKEKSKVKTCRVCGCTEDNACIDDGTGETCYWVEDDLCSSCL